MENRLRLLFQLQQVDARLDDVQDMKGDLPHIVAELEQRLAQKEAQKKELEEFVKKAIVSRDEMDLEILALKEQIEKYKTQQFQVKTNRQYDALAREADHALEKIIKLEQEMEVLEGKANTARVDAEKLVPEIEELRTLLEERKAELAQVNEEHEDEELRLKHEREKIVVRLEKADVRLYERIRKAKGGKAVVSVRRNACGGCFNRVPPQKVLELRKNARIITCEHCGRVLVSDEIAENISHS